MNTDNDQLERILGSELRDRAADLSGVSVSFQDVRGRATSIRRRRRIGVGVGLAAAAAILAPVAITAGGLADRAGPVEPATPVPTRIARTTLTLDGLERGAAPTIEYFTEDGVMLPGTGLQPLPDSLQALVPSPADGGWLALSPSRGEVIVLSDSLEHQSARSITQTLLSNPDRSAVAWTQVGSDGQTLTLHPTTEADTDVTWDFPNAPLVDPVDFTGERGLLFQTTKQSDGSHQIGIAHDDGTTTQFDGDFVRAVSASPETGLVAVQTRTNEDASGCFGIVDPASSTSQTVWDTCDYSLGAFSPDGRHVLASDPFMSGLGPTSLSVLDAATGELVATYRSKRRAQITLITTAWESSDAIVAVAIKGLDNTILRFGLDGTLEESVEPVDGDPLVDVPFYLGFDRRRGGF